MPNLIRARALIDGKGGVERNALVSVESEKISRVAQASMIGVRWATYDFSKLTLLPGMIDTYVRLNHHFGPEGRHVVGEVPAPDAT